MLTDGFQIFLAETVGTAVLIILGDGVVAGVLLARSKAQNAGWIVITTGWALAVAVGVYAIGSLTGAHLNPAVTIGLAAIGLTGWDVVPWYLGGEFLGAFIGAVVVWLHYLPHWAETEDPGLKLAVFSTGPAIRNTTSNLISEIIGTFMLVFGVLAITTNELGPGLAALLVGFLVWGIGLSLGGPTGYAINPARDLGPRIAHAVLPIAGKGDSDWAYSWIPVVGPIIGGILGAVAYNAIFTNYLMGA
jgi:glycerol uptake facilitator protein